MYYIKHRNGKIYYLTQTICWNGEPGYTWCVDDKTGPWLGPYLRESKHRGGRISWIGHHGGHELALRYAKENCAVIFFDVEFADSEEWDDH